MGADCSRPPRASTWRRTVAEPQFLARPKLCGGGLGLGGGARAGACLAALIYRGTLARQPLIATIEGDGPRHFIATIDASRGTVAVVPATFSPDATRVPELWLIPPDGKPRPV